MIKLARDLAVGDVVKDRLGSSIVKGLSREYGDPFHDHLRTVHVKLRDPDSPAVNIVSLHPDQPLEVLRSWAGF